MTLEEKKEKLRQALRQYSKEELLEKLASYGAHGPSIVDFVADFEHGRPRHSSDEDDLKHVSP